MPFETIARTAAKRGVIRDVQARADALVEE